MRRRLVAGLMCAVLTPVACSGDDGPATRPSSESEAATATDATAAEAAPDSGETVTEYFELLAVSDFGPMAQMLDLATPGSRAHLYAQHQIAVVRIGGPTVVANEVGEENIRSCGQVMGVDGQPEDRCFEFAGFEVNPDTGLLEAFTVDGIAIRDRITTGAPVTNQDVSVKLVTAYQSAARDFVVNTDITNNRPGPVAVADYDWSYVAPDGRQVAPTDIGVPGPDVEPGATAAYAAVFAQAPVGGTLRFAGFADDFSTEIRFDVPTTG